MIEIITPNSYQDCAAELDAMFRFRHRVFCERMGWDVRSEAGRERDQFDALSPIYLIAKDARGELVATWRLLPTTGSYMIRDVFPDLMEGRPMPCDPSVWETSRFAVAAGGDAGAGLKAVSAATHELFCGLVEYGIQIGIREIITLYDIRIARLLPRVGCRPKWRTAGKRLDDTIAIVGMFDVNEAVLANLRAVGGLERSVLSARSRATIRSAA